MCKTLQNEMQFKANAVLKLMREDHIEAHERSKPAMPQLKNDEDLRSKISAHPADD